MRKVWECSLRWRWLQCLCLLLVSLTILLSTSIESSAEESLNFSEELLVNNLSIATDDILKEFNMSSSGYLNYYGSYEVDFGVLDFAQYFDGVIDSESLYRVEYDFYLNCGGVSTNSGSVALTNLVLKPSDNEDFIFTDVIFASSNTAWGGVIDYTSHDVKYFTASQLSRNYDFFGYYFGSSASSISFNIDIGFSNISVTKVSSSDSEDYQNGYNAGYADGETDGYDNGYSNGFADGEASVDTDAIYDEAYQAGKDSVDTDSYYDAGYSAGYSEGEAQGYEDGYNKGYDDALEVIESFGADTTQYPLHVTTVSNSNTYTTSLPVYNFPTDIEYIPYEFDMTSSDFNPKYVYCISGFLENFCFGGQFFAYDDAEILLMVGGSEYFIGSMSGGYDNKFSPGFKVFVSGSNISTKIGIKVIAYNAYGTVEKETDRYPYMNLITDACTMYVQNYGPVNGTQQNAIANQTEILEGTLEEQKEIQQGQLEEQKEQTETQKGMLASIKEFFGSFFQNLIDSIIGIFVPSQEEMSELFNRLNDFFAETFGFLYYPFDFIIDAFNIFLEADSETGLTLPGFSIMGYEVWGNQTYDIASEPIVGTIFGYVRMGTGAMLAMWFVNYLRNFFDKRFGGGGN